MVRALKFHEQKLLKKVDLYKDERNVRVVEILRKYHVQRREDYTKYNRLAGLVTKIARKLINLDPKDPFRVASTDQLLAKLCARLPSPPLPPRLRSGDRPSHMGGALKVPHGPHRVAKEPDAVRRHHGLVVLPVRRVGGLCA